MIQRGIPTWQNSAVHSSFATRENNEGLLPSRRLAVWPLKASEGMKEVLSLKKWGAMEEEAYLGLKTMSL